MQGRLEVSAFPVPDRWRANKRLGGKVATSPRDLTTWEHHLPWPRCSIPTPSRLVKASRADAPTRTATAAASSRAANAGSARPGPRPVTAPQPVSTPPAAGDVGELPSATVLRTTASSAAAPRANAIATGSGSAGSRWPHSRRHPRASAQPQFDKIFRASRATDPVATNSFLRRHAPQTSGSVRRPAARRYVAFASVR